MAYGPVRLIFGSSSVPMSSLPGDRCRSSVVVSTSARAKDRRTASAIAAGRARASVSSSKFLYIDSSALRSSR
jgi:hypothetical protein